jgi:hypothetical protein
VRLGLLPNTKRIQRGVGLAMVPFIPAFGTHPIIPANGKTSIAALGEASEFRFVPGFETGLRIYSRAASNMAWRFGSGVSTAKVHPELKTKRCWPSSLSDWRRV